MRVFSEMNEITKIHCFDLDKETLRRLKDRWRKVEISWDLDAIMCNPRIELAVIATPAKCHYLQARQALLNGKNVLVEKPFTSNYEEARELFDIAAEKEVVLRVGHIMLHNPGFKKLKELVFSGDLGGLCCLRFERTHLGMVREDVDILDDLGPHDLSMLLDLAGEIPSRVWARGMGVVGQKGLDSAVVTLAFPSGLFAYLYFSWLEPLKVRRCIAVGDKKMAVFDDMEPTHKVRIYEYRVAQDFQARPGRFYYSCGNVMCPHVEEKEPLKEQCLEVVRAIILQEKRNPRLPLTVQAVMDAVRYSVHRGGEEVVLPFWLKNAEVEGRRQQKQSGLTGSRHGES